MSQLTFARQWLFNANNITNYTVEGSGALEKRTLLDIKNILIGGAGRYGWTSKNGAATTSPAFWTVDHSCNSITAGAPGDGVDYWSVYTNLVWNSLVGANSWIVLKNTSAIVGKTLYWLINLENASSDVATLDMWTSKAGFGLIHGGTNGTATSRPTASDEINMRVSAAWGSNSSRQMTYTIMMSSDGAATRVIINKLALTSGVWLLEPMAGCVAGIEDDFITACYGSISSLQVSNFSTTPQIIARASAGGPISGVLAATGSTWISDPHPTASLSSRILWNDMSQSDQVMSASAWGTTYPYRGHIGSLVDLWFGNNSIMAGQTFPGDYSRQLVSNGPLILPWNGTVPEMI